MGRCVERVSPSSCSKDIPGSIISWAESPPLKTIPAPSRNPMPRSGEVPLWAPAGAALGSYCKAFEECHLSQLCFLFCIRFNPEPLGGTSNGVRNHLLALTSSWDAGEESFWTSVYINAKSLSWEAWVIPAGDWWNLCVILEFVFYKLVGGKKCQSISTFSRTNGLGKNKFGYPVKDLYPPLHLPWILSSRAVAVVRQSECKSCYHYVFAAFSKY